MQAPNHRPGAKCIIKVPDSFPPFHKYDGTWLKWAESHHDKEIVLDIEFETCGVQGWRVTSEIPVPSHPSFMQVLSWFPNEWISTGICDCTPRKLFQQGCRGH